MSNQPKPEPKPSSGQLADELESFRRQWREDLRTVKPPTVPRSKGESSSSASQQVPPTTVGATGSSRSDSNTAAPAHKRRQSQHARDELRHAQAHAQALRLQQEYHEDGVRSLDLDVAPSAPILGAGERTLAGAPPSTALEIYEAAVEKERAGNVDESVKLYKRSFKMDPQVHDRYKEKYFPRKAGTGSGKSAEPSATEAPSDPQAILPTIELVATFASLPIIPGTEVNLAALKGKDSWKKPPPCPVSSIPREILIQIFSRLAEVDVASFVRCVTVCKAFSYLVYSERQIWKNLCEDSWDKMVWGPKWACDMKGRPLSQTLGPGEDMSDLATLPSKIAALDLLDEDEDEDLAVGGMVKIVLPTRPYDDVEVLKYNSSYRSMFIERPRIRFNGIYISTCTYFRPGHSVNTNLTLSNPIHQVTYYRYLRFFPSGFVLYLVTPSEPSDVVHSITLENYKNLITYSMPIHHTSAIAVPASLAHIKTLLPGRWRAIFNPLTYLSPNDTEQAGSRIEIEAEGSSNSGKYVNTLDLSVKMRPKGLHGRRGYGDLLTWNSYTSYNRLTDDRANYSLKNDKSFCFSRVKSYD